MTVTMPELLQIQVLHRLKQLIVQGYVRFNILCKPACELDIGTLAAEIVQCYNVIIFVMATHTQADMKMLKGAEYKIDFFMDRG